MSESILESTTTFTPIILTDETEATMTSTGNGYADAIQQSILRLRDNPLLPEKDFILHFSRVLGLAAQTETTISSFHDGDARNLTIPATRHCTTFIGDYVVSYALSGLTVIDPANNNTTLYPRDASPANDIRISNEMRAVLTSKSLAIVVGQRTPHMLGEILVAPRNSRYSTKRDILEIPHSHLAKFMNAVMSYTLKPKNFASLNKLLASQSQIGVYDCRGGITPFISSPGHEDLDLVVDNPLFYIASQQKLDAEVIEALVLNLREKNQPLHLAFSSDYAPNT